MGILKYFYIHLIYPFVAIYIRKERSYTFKGFHLSVLPGVFHPQFFFSTKYLYNFIDALEIKGKKCIEIGCGSGLLSLHMLRKGAQVTAIDIQDAAIRTTEKNYNRNKSQFKSELRIFKSNLFDELNAEKFDFMIINPPYFFAPVTNESELPWYCGENGEYFSKLFKDLHLHIEEHTQIYMILADNCDIKRIEGIARVHNFNLVPKEQRRIWWENNYIMQIVPLS